MVQKRKAKAGRKRGECLSILVGSNHHFLDLRQRALLRVPDHFHLDVSGLCPHHHSAAHQQRNARHCKQPQRIVLVTPPQQHVHVRVLAIGRGRMRSRRARALGRRPHVIPVEVTALSVANATEHLVLGAQSVAMLTALGAGPDKVHLLHTVELFAVRFRSVQRAALHCDGRATVVARFAVCGSVVCALRSLLLVDVAMVLIVAVHDPVRSRRKVCSALWVRWLSLVILAQLQFQLQLQAAGVAIAVVSAEVQIASLDTTSTSIADRIKSICLSSISKHRHITCAHAVYTWTLTLFEGIQFGF